MRNSLWSVGCATVILLLLPMSRAQVAPDVAKKLYEEVSPSMVAVQFTWEYEFGKLDFVGAGVVVSEEGLVIMSLGLVNPIFPDAQLTDFKLIIPSRDNFRDDEEIDATFVGRDERSNLVFVRCKDPSRKWKPVKFEDAPAGIGEAVLSIGLLPKAAGYRTYISEGIVAGHLRGEVHHVLVTGGGLASIGAPVFDIKGRAIGLVNVQPGQDFILHTSNLRAQQAQQQDPLASVSNPPRIFVPAAEFLGSLKDPPTEGKPLPMPWMGTPQLSGLKKEVAEVFGLENQAAIEIGDVVPNSPADRAGLKVGMKIVKMNGQPLERGDEPDEVAAIMGRKLMRLKPGDEVTFSVFTEKEKPLQDIKVKLEERPRRANVVNRYWADDLGFSSREVTFEDTYVRKMPPDSKGVVISLVKPQSAAASAKLGVNDMVTSLNGATVESLEQFQKDYQAFRTDKPKEAIVMVVTRVDGQTATIRIEPPQ